MKSFRFIHAADIHLDSPLKGLSGYEASMIERIRSATREAFKQLVELAINEEVDFMIISGDLYDGDWRDINTGLFFSSQMGRLKEANIPVYLIHGNHDAESQITRKLTLPDNVNVFDNNKPQTYRIEELEVALHGQSYKNRDITDNLAIKYPKPVDGNFNIGVLHTALGGREGHQNYAPCSIDELVNKGYDYWALGHVHKSEVIHENPYIVFSGNLQGRHIRETGSKGAYLVSVNEGQVVDLDMLECDDVRWVVIPITIENCTNITEIYDCIRRDVLSAHENLSDGRLLSCRIELCGRTEFHEQLITSEEKILDEARSIAFGLGHELAWIEKVIIKTEPALNNEAINRPEDVIGELQHMLEDAVNDSDVLEQLEENISQMINMLPHESRQVLDDNLLKIALEGNYHMLAERVIPNIFARLLQEEN